ncbi:MAG: protein translocase subunit SecF [Mogibacterium sp.]|nr:protein translocase subunit SecF [Mogibacterium sp.]
MKSGTRKFFAVLIAVVMIGGWIISIFGAGSFQKLSKQLKYGLDINGGVYVLLEADTELTGTDRQALMEQTRAVIERRVDALGVANASVSIEGTNRIRVEMPGVEDADEAIKQIGKTAQLRFLLADGTEVMTGDAVTNASFTTDSENGRYKITMEFTKEGSEKFTQATATALSGSVVPSIQYEDGTYVASNAIVIMLDDEIVSAPSVKQIITSTSCEITRPNGFSQTEASSTSALIRGGALPASLSEINSSVETATIGADALTKSAKAGVIGLFLVFILMIIVYGVLGFVADIALALYVEMVLWIMVAFGSVLTLPGIAGLILSIGMAVDANVIIFTGIREEIAKGKSVRVAVDQGFRSALSTVIDSQTTTLIAAIVLYLLGTAQVKGFALTLMIGTVCSIFTAVFVTQIFVTLMADSKKFGTPAMFGMKADGTPKGAFRGHINFIKNSKKYFAASAIVLVIGLCMALFKGFNYGIDFTGGTMMQIDMGTKVDITEVKETIASYELDPIIVYAGDENEQIIIRTIKDLKADERTQVFETLKAKYNLEDDAVLASEEFGPTVGRELRSNAIRAIIIAGLCMLVYIRFRFKTWKYGFAAVSGLTHDVLMTLALYAIFRFTINNPFIAGILTVVGYSINNTIVVFDRIRSNAKFYKRKDIKTLIDDSINQTLTRSIMTSLTTFIVMIPLFVLVSSELRQFLIPLIIGVLVGTYSSVFLCGPLLYQLSRKDNLSKYVEQKERDDRERARRNKMTDKNGRRLRSNDPDNNDGAVV